MLDVHSLIRDGGMGPFPILAFSSSQLLGLPLRFLLFKLVTFLKRNDIFPVHIILDIADVSKLREEAFTTKGSAFARVGHRFVMFGVVEDVVEIHLVQLLVLIAVILVETNTPSRRRETVAEWGKNTNQQTQIPVVSKTATDMVTTTKKCG